MAEIIKPVIILGSPRAGTTILGQILEQHRVFVHVVEPRLIWRYGNDGRSDQLLAKHAHPKVVQYIRDRFARILDEGNGSRLLEKLPSNALRIPFIEQIFPDAQYIHITRNGFDSALSIRSFWTTNTHGTSSDARETGESILRQRIREIQPRQVPYYMGELLARTVLPKPKDRPASLWGPRLPGLKGMVKDMELLEVAAMQWRQCVELARHNGLPLGPKRYKEVRLEDLTLPLIEEILSYLGLDMDPNIEKFYRETFKSEQSGARRKTLSDIDRDQLQRILTPTMEWLGYEQY